MVEGRVPAPADGVGDMVDHSLLVCLICDPLDVGRADVLVTLVCGGNVCVLSASVVALVVGVVVDGVVLVAGLFGTVSTV